MRLAPLCVFLTGVASIQIPLGIVPTGLSWTTLGPFPLGSREGPLLPPLSPDLSIKHHASPLVDGAFTSARTVFENDEGWMEVGDDSPAVRWKDLKSTAGWSILQHQRFYTREIVVPRSASPTSTCAFSLTAGAEFSLRRLFPNSTASSATWYHGNMYSYENAPPHFVELDSGATYALSVTYHHDIRIAGDIAAVGDDGVPRSKWKMEVELVDDSPVAEPRRSLVPGTFAGRLMGDVVGVEVSFALLAPTVLAPFQTRLVPLILTQHKNLPESRNPKSHTIPVTLSLSTGGEISLELDLPTAPASGPIQSTFLSNTQTPSYSMYTPPSKAATTQPGTIVALHGAGLDPATTPAWTSSIPQRKTEWMVWPIGLTPWGYDWHGATLVDVKLALKHLREVKRAWYFLSRFPDEVLGGVPASGYVKIQDYVPYNFAVGRHYRDPALTGILDAALTTWDNDLHASNLAGMPILNRHGGDDDNVPVQHSRQLVSAVERWSGNSSLITFSEVPGEGHWWEKVFDAPEVSTFLDSLFLNKTRPAQGNVEFTITTANPEETGSKNGFRIVELETPGRLARITVRIYSDPETMQVQAILKTRNVRSFSIDQTLLESLLGVLPSNVVVNSRPSFPLLATPSQQTFTLDPSTPHLSPSPSPSSTAPRRYGPLLAILTSPNPLQIIIGTSGSEETTQHLASIASRISHDAYLYGKVTSVILRDSEVGAKTAPGNVVLIGGSHENSVVKSWARDWPVPVDFLAPGAFAVGGEIFQTPGQGEFVAFSVKCQTRV
ncbi:hypothetical protein RQP46_009851 [Phenoliferia psychrophenolica]